MDKNKDDMDKDDQEFSMIAERRMGMSIFKERQQLLEYQEAIQEDYEEVLRKYEKFNTFDYATFCSLWSEFNLNLVYAGSYRSQELGHFTDMVFTCAKKYIIFPKSLNIRIGGLYLLYGLYYKQPIPNMVKIRLLKHEYKVLVDLMNEMREKFELDPLYVYGKLLSDEAFYFCTTHFALGFELKYFPSDLILDDNIFPTGTEDVEKALQNATENIDTLCKTENEYRSCLGKFLEKRNHFMTTYPLTLKEDFADILKEEIEDTSSPSEKEDELDIAERRRRIRRKAYIHKKAERPKIEDIIKKAKIKKEVQDNADDNE